MYTPKLITRAQWGAKDWATPVYHIDVVARDYFFAHYNGHPPRNTAGIALAKEIESEHRNQGWAGPGYNFMVGQDGVILEGRGWELVGAHCPGFNTRGIGVYGAVGDLQELTPEAKSSFRWLRDEQARLRSGKGVVTTFHGAHYPTACCGVPTKAWVNSGMPAAGVTAQPTTRPPVVVSRPPLRATLKVDGKLGDNTIHALRVRLAAAGMKPNTSMVDATKALQRYLNAKLGGVDLAVDGKGFVQDNHKYLTVAALQRWLGVGVDGILSVPVSAAVARMQDRLNRGNF